jgi:porin
MRTISPTQHSSTTSSGWIFIDRGFWPARPHDQINFGFTYYTVSDKLTATERLQQAWGLPLAGGALGVQTDAAVLELSYGMEVRPGFLFQPVLEYFIRPGATDDVPNAFLVGLKTCINF